MELTTYFNMDFHQPTPPSYSQVSSNSTFYEETPTPTPTPAALALAPAPEQQQHFLSYYDPHDESFFFLPNTTTFDNNSFNFDQTSFLYPHHDDLLLHCASSNYDYEYNNPIFTSFSNDNNEEDHYNLLPCSKRQKCFHDHQHDQNSNYIVPTNFFDDGLVPMPNPCSMISEELAALQEAQLFTTAMQEFKVPQLSQGGGFGASNDDDHNHKINEKTTTISAQSLAARERRRKITEKTQELGKLVPGGSKLNTAEMLNAAGKYVQYLQAQVAMLQLMKTLQEEEAETSIEEDLQALLVSPSLQEKMYSQEKCFVPKDFVATLTNHDNLQSSPSILKDLKNLIATDIKKKTKQE